MGQPGRLSPKADCGCVVFQWLRLSVDVYFTESPPLDIGQLNLDRPVAGGQWRVSPTAASKANAGHEEISSLERCVASIWHEPHDRVPVDLHNFMMTLAGVQMPTPRTPPATTSVLRIRYWPPFAPRARKPITASADWGPRTLPCTTTRARRTHSELSHCEPEWFGGECGSWARPVDQTIATCWTSKADRSNLFLNRPR
jgi:hypothetical protein